MNRDLFPPTYQSAKPSGPSNKFLPINQTFISHRQEPHLNSSIARCLRCHSVESLGSGEEDPQ